MQDDPEYWRGQLNTYYDLIVGTDEMLGAAVKELIDAGVLDDTVIVRTADHGELGSAHRLQNKGTTIYDEQNRVPFTVVYPKRFPRGRRSQALGEAVDLVPDAARDRRRARPGPPLAVAARRQPRVGARGPRRAGPARLDPLPDRRVPGHQRRHGGPDPHATSARSSTAATSSPATSRSPTSTSPARSSSTSQEYELYDTWNDPYEIRNLANDPGYAGARRGPARLAATSARSAKFGPVELPAYGARRADHHDPRAAEHRASPSSGIPNPWVGAQPGSYLIVPLEQPRPGALPLRGRAAAAASAARPNAERAADLARFFCELMPRS